MKNMSTAMSSQEINDFLSKGNIARIAIIKPDNSPHVSPVWYLWENNELLIEIIKGTVKERSIRKNNKVAVTIDTTIAPYKAVIIEGKAKIEEPTNKIRERLNRRYVKTEFLDEFNEWETDKYQYILLRIRPEKIISWDNSKEPVDWLTWFK